MSQVRAAGVVVREVTTDEYAARLRAWAAEDGEDGLTSEDEIAAELGRHRGTVTLDVRPFARLADGREILSDPALGQWEIDVMGFLVSAPAGEGTVPRLTPAVIEKQVQDDFFEPSDSAADRWSWLVMTLSGEGIDVEASELDELPFEIRLDPGLTAFG